MFKGGLFARVAFLNPLLQQILCYKQTSINSEGTLEVDSDME